MNDTSPIIGFCSYRNPKDMRAWSGTIYFMNKALQKHFSKVVPVGHENFNFFELMRKVNRLREIVYKNVVRGKNIKFSIKRNYEMTMEFKRKYLYKDLAKNAYDVLFFPSGWGLLLADLETTLPTLFVNDATAKLMTDYYPDFMQMDDLYRELYFRSDKRSIEKASKVIYSSRWAVRSAIEDYHCNENKVHLALFGANLEAVPSRDEVLSRKRINSDKCRLLFVGVDWVRKGGQIAFETMIELNKRGINAELTVSGCYPPSSLRHEKLKVTGFLDKRNKIQMLRLIDNYMNASFFIFPTKAECAAIVISEAAAFGLPVISTDTGGVSSYVEDGISGKLLSLEAKSDFYADTIEKIWADKKLYINMCEKARDKYEKELNWDSWADKIKEVIAAL